MNESSVTLLSVGLTVFVLIFIGLCCRRCFRLFSKSQEHPGNETGGQDDIATSQIVLAVDCHLEEDPPESSILNHEF